jgi:polysaccharide export outer membrane protein
MNMSKLRLLFFGLFCVSCVSNKQYQILQKNDVNKKRMHPDSVFRNYSIENFDYKIQANDILSITFESLTTKDFDFLSHNTQVNLAAVNVGGPLLIGEVVDNRGEIPFPVLGKVRVAGQTIFEIQDNLQAIASKYLEGPLVKVRLLNFRVNLLGQVNREGLVVLNNNRATLLEAIGLAGGLTDLADKSSVKLVRQNGNKVDVVYLNLLDEAFINSPYYYAHQNDLIIVPALRQRSYQKYFYQNLSILLSTISIVLLVLNYTK